MPRAKTFLAALYKYLITSLYISTDASIYLSN